MTSLHNLLAVVASIGFAIKPVSSIHISEVKCTNRLEFRHEIRERRFTTCEEVIKDNPYCGKTHHVAWTSFPPYVFYNHHTGNVSGILPTMLELALESCCFDCSSVKYDGPYHHMVPFFLDNASYVIPTQASVQNIQYLGQEYIHMLPVMHLGVFAIPPKADVIKRGTLLLASIGNTYPLLLLVVLMSVTAGVCVWVLDTKWNAGDFPDTFPKGILEGTWWAFVSMTTVGYGDKTPKGPIARTFAAFWMLIGITICSIYTATLTGALMSVVSAENEVSFYQKKIAILDQTSIGMVGVAKINAIPVVYEDLDELVKGVLNGEAEGFALDDYMTNFFQEQLSEVGLGDYRLLERISIDGISFGMVTFNQSDALMFRSFFRANDDNRNLMAYMAMSEHQHIVDMDPSIEAEPFFTISSPLYILTVISLVAICIVITLIGVGIKRVCLKKHYEGHRVEDGLNLGDFSKEDFNALRSLINSLHQRNNNLCKEDIESDGGETTKLTQ